MEQQREKMYIGIDMGGTNTAFGIVNAAGVILHRDAIATEGYAKAEDYVDALSVAVMDLVERSGVKENVVGIGIGAPNGNYDTGVIENAANIPWAKGIRVPLAEMITGKTGLPCKLTNDANAAAVGENVYGVAKGMKDFIVITLGTGLGSGIFCNGQLVVGSDGFAGELGHTNIVRNGRRCGCGRYGCLETYCSAPGVARTAMEYLALTNKPSLLREMTDDRPISSKDVFLAAEKGDELAIEIFNYTGRVLADALCDFIAFSSPQAIILFGGLAHAGDYLLKPLKEELDKQIMDIFRGHTEILLSNLNDAEAAILGASALAWE